jgi:hypothetical protein
VRGRGVRLRFRIRENERSPEGQPVIAFGVRIGYWPCVIAPFVQVAAFAWRFEVWYGLPPKPGKEGLVRA